MSTPFDTLDDDGTPQWRHVYDLAAGRKYGVTITYDELAAVLHHDPRDQRSPIYRAVAHLEKERARTLVPVPRVGYRIAEPDEIPTLVRGRVRRATRQATRGRRTARHAPLGRMSSEKRAELADMDARLSRVEAAARRAERKADEAHERIDDVTAALRKAGLSVVPDRSNLPFRM